EVEVVPERNANAALCALILELSIQSGLPAYATVGGRHVDHGCSRPGCRIHIRAGDEVRHLVAAPALALYGEFRAVYPRHFSQLFHARIDVFLGGSAGIADFVSNVRRKNDVSVAHEEADIQPR